MKNKSPYEDIYGAVDVSDEAIPKAKKKTRLPRMNLSTPKLISILVMTFAFLIMVVAAPVTEYIKSTGEVTVVIATQDLSENTVIIPEMVKEVQIPKSELLAQFSLTLNDIIGKYTSSFIGANEPLSFKRLSDKPVYKDEFLYSLPEGKQAISVTLTSMAASVSGKILPNDIVTVFACPPNTETNNAAVHPNELKYVKVLDVNTTEGASVADGSEATAPQMSTVTLLVNGRQASILAYFDKTAPVHLSLTCRGDDKKATVQLAEQEQILADLLLDEETELAANADEEEEKKE